MVDRHTITPEHANPDKLWSLSLDAAILPGVVDFTITERDLIYLPAGGVGGNHKHPRTEAFLGIGSGLILLWQDKAGTIHREQMDDSKGLTLFVVRSMTPHAVVNKAAGPAVLIEFADAAQHGVEPADLLH